MIMFCKLLILALFLTAAVQSLPTGAPILACDAMRPEHGLHQPQPSEESPYHVKAMVDPKQANRVIINVSSSNKSLFKGIFLQARESENERAVGSWTIPSDGNNFRHVDCNENPPSALTHTNNHEKSLPLLFEWTAPEMWESPQVKSFRIYASIVKDYKTFYVKLPSNQFMIEH